MPRESIPAKDLSIEQEVSIVFFHPPQRDGDLERVFAILARILARVAQAEPARLELAHKQPDKQAA